MKPNMNAFAFYDIFLINPEGRIVYSYFKETDFATSLVDGPWANSNLAKTWREARDMGMPNWFADYDNYTPSYEAPASFLVLEVKEDDKRIGHIAFQIPVQQVSAIMSNTIGLGDTGETLLVGEDYLMRSDARLKPDTHSLQTSWANPATGKVETEDTRAVQQTGDIRTIETRDYRGEQVLTSYTPIALWNVVWALSAKQDLSELYAAVEKTRHIISIAVMVTILVVILSSVFFSSRLTAPIRALKNTMHTARTSGNLNLRGSIVNQDEIGDMTEAFNELMQNQQNMVKDLTRTLTAIAQGNFSVSIDNEYRGDLAHLKRQGNGTVDVLRNTMAQLRQTADSLKAGNFRVQMDTSKLTGDYRSIMISLSQAMKQVDETISAISGTMKYLTRFELDNRLSFEAKGDLARLRDQINSTMTHLQQGFQAAIDTAHAMEQGDVSSQMSGSFTGALAQLQLAINHSLERFNLTLGTVSGRARDSLSNGQSISQLMLQASGSMTHQAAAVQQTAVAMEELSAQAHNTASSADCAATQAAIASDKVSQGVEVMNQSMTAMNEIRKSSRRITEILTLIDSIAFQTNLLALNAAVEAARAGEHGKGFAVVAGEVRALSQKTVQAASDIKELIENNNLQITQGASLIDTAGNTMQDINEQITAFRATVQEIQNKNQEQALAIEQSNSNIQQINQINQQSLKDIDLAAKQSQQLQSSVSYLAEQMENFTLNRKAVDTANDLARIAANTAQDQNPPQKKPSNPAQLPAPKTSDKPETRRLGTSQDQPDGDEWAEF